MARRGIRRRREDSKGPMVFLVLVALVIIGVHIGRLYLKDQEYIAREKELTAQLEQETERQSEIEAYEEYIGSKEYVEDTAKSKLGLVYDNEIIFKEKENN